MKLSKINPHRLLLLLLALSCVSARGQDAASTTNSPWQRVVMIGASATAGFTESEPLGGPKTKRYQLNRYIDAALLAPHEPVRNAASTMFFLQPTAESRRQIDVVLKAKPTLVLALDFLFWFSYGDAATDDERKQRFEQGLKLLEEIPCPLVVGDVPDASGASADVLQPDWIPSAASRAAANQRLKQWAAGRKQVAVVSLSDFMRAVVANEPLTVHGETVAAGKTRALLQADQLHPSPRGCAVLALALLDAAQPKASTNEVRWDAKEILRVMTGGTNNVAKPAL